MGSTLILAGIVIAATGQYWQKSLTSVLTAPHWSEQLVLRLPYWPFEPFYSLAIIGIGTLLLTQTINDTPHSKAKALSYE